MRGKLRCLPYPEEEPDCEGIHIGPDSVKHHLLHHRLLASLGCNAVLLLGLLEGSFHVFQILRSGASGHGEGPNGSHEGSIA